MPRKTDAKIVAELRDVKIPDFHWNKETKELEDCFISPTVFTNDDGAIAHVSAEDGKGLVDYYGEYRGGYPYINIMLEDFARNHGCMWEWINPGCVGLFLD